MVTTRSGSQTSSTKDRKEDGTLKKTLGGDTMKGRRRRAATARHDEEPKEASPKRKKQKTTSTAFSHHYDTPTIQDNVLNIRPPGKTTNNKDSVHSNNTITINRAPVMTLFAATCLYRTQQFSWAESLSLASACAALNAQSKGRALGIYEPKELTDREREAKRQKRREEEEAGRTKSIRVLGRPVTAVATRVEGGTNDILWLGRVGSSSGGGGGKNKPQDPRYVSSYLQRKFGNATNYEAAYRAMDELAGTLTMDELTGRTSYELYEQIRPAWKGWGRPSALDLNHVYRLASERSARGGDTVGT